MLQDKGLMWALLLSPLGVSNGGGVKGGGGLEARERGVLLVVTIAMHMLAAIIITHMLAAIIITHMLAANIAATSQRRPTGVPPNARITHHPFSLRHFCQST